MIWKSCSRIGERAADDHRGDDAVADGERALDADHLPIGCARAEEIDRAD